MRKGGGVRKGHIHFCPRQYRRIVPRPLKEFWDRAQLEFVPHIERRLELFACGSVQAWEHLDATHCLPLVCDGRPQDEPPSAGAYVKKAELRPSGAVSTCGRARSIENQREETQWKLTIREGHWWLLLARDKGPVAVGA